jgi:pyruvate dehydrogenase E2 component (dihydrolipoamide acetyltransferase)
MLIDLKMPDLATTEAEITILRWLVEVGEAVAQGQPVVEVETDKAAMEVEAYAAGTLSEILAQPGESVDVGQVIARLAVQGPAPASADSAAAPVPPLPAPPPAAAGPTPAAAKGGMFARNRQAAAAGSAAPAPAASVTPPAPPPGLPLNATAAAVARRMQESKQTIPHFYLQMTAAAEPLLARRAAALPLKLAWDAFFVYAVARALVAFPKLGCHWDSGHLLPAENDSIGVAVDLDDDLFVVSVPDASAKTPEQISEHIRTAVDALRRHDPEARRLTHNRMTVTNLGMTGVDAFAAIINPPEAAVLAVGKIGPAVVAENGLPVVRQRVTLTLSVDHRVANGRYAAGFLSHVVAALESLDQNEP